MKPKNNPKSNQLVNSNFFFWLLIFVIAYAFFVINKKSVIPVNSPKSKKVFNSKSLTNNNLKTPVIGHSKLGLNNQKSVVSVPWSQLFKTAPVNDIKVDPKGKLWAATESGLVSILNDKVTYYQQKLGSFPVPQAECLAFGGNKLWIGSLFGLFSINSDGILHNEDVDNKLSSHIIWSLCFDTQKLWVGTQNGLALLGKDKKIIEFNKTNTNAGLRSSWCQHLKKFGPWMIISHDKGISIWNMMFPASNNGAWKNIDAFKAGIALPITGIEYDGKTLWLSTNKGILKMPSSLENLFANKVANFINYTTIHGIPSDFVNSIVLINDSLWAGTDSGLVRIKGDEITKIQPLQNNEIFEIRSMTSSGDILWIGTNKGLYYLNTAMVN